MIFCGTMCCQTHNIFIWDLRVRVDGDVHSAMIGQRESRVLGCIIATLGGQHSAKCRRKKILFCHRVFAPGERYGKNVILEKM